MHGATRILTSTSHRPLTVVIQFDSSESYRALLSVHTQRSTGSDRTCRTAINMGEMGCGRHMYYDKPTRSCTHCSILCDDMDIQDTRDQCIKYCFDYMQTTSTTTPETSTHPAVTHQVPVIATCVLLFLIIILILASLVCYHRKRIVDRLKRQDCCRDTSQPHAQETGQQMDNFRYAQETREDSAKPEAHSLLPSGHDAFPEMPQPR